MTPAIHTDIKYKDQPHSTQIKHAVSKEAKGKEVTITETNYIAITIM
jgi:hypothetical protein